MTDRKGFKLHEWLLIASGIALGGAVLMLAAVAAVHGMYWPWPPALDVALAVLVAISVGCAVAAIAVVFGSAFLPGGWWWRDE